MHLETQQAITMVAKSTSEEYEELLLKRNYIGEAGIEFLRTIVVPTVG